MPATVIDLGNAVKAKYPGQYDDVDSAALGRAQKLAHPGAYDDFTEPVSAPVPSWGSQFLSSLSDSAQNLIPNAMKIFDQPPRLSMLHDFDTALTDQLSRAVHGDPEALGSLAAQAPLALGGMEFDPAALTPSAGGAADALFSGIRGVKNLGTVGKGVVTGAAKSAHEAPLLTIGGDLMSRALGRGDLGAAAGAIPPIVGGIRGGIEAARGLGRSAFEDIPSASTRSVPGKLFTIPGRSESIPSPPLSPAPTAPPGEPMPIPTTPSTPTASSVAPTGDTPVALFRLHPELEAVYAGHKNPTAALGLDREVIARLRAQNITAPTNAQVQAARIAAGKSAAKPEDLGAIGDRVRKTMGILR